jgi:hypothetical protein
VKRFGEYVLDMNAAAGELDGHLELPTNLVQLRVAALAD